MPDEIERTKCYNPSQRFPGATARFERKFVNDLRSSACGVCDNLFWFAGDLTSLETVRKARQRGWVATVCISNVRVRAMCREALLRGTVPHFTTWTSACIRLHWHIFWYFSSWSNNWSNRTFLLYSLYGVWHTAVDSLELRVKTCKKQHSAYLDTLVTTVRPNIKCLLQSPRRPAFLLLKC